MDLPISLPDIGKLFPSVSLPNLQLPLVLLAAVFRRVLLEVVNIVSTIANSLAILISYIYLKNFRRHSLIIVDGYIAIFKTFAEFISAVVCLCYGLIEIDIFYTVLGFVGIVMGLILKALLLYGQRHEPSNALRAATYSLCGLYTTCVLTCSFAFHALAISIGILPCITRILTCVVPLVALSEFFRVSGPLGRYFTYLADFVAFSVMWYYCSHLSFKYFVLVPSVIGLVFSFIQFALAEMQKATSKDVELDIFQRQ